MGRTFVKQVPRLVRQRLGHVPGLSATGVVEALEDAAHLRFRDRTVEEFVSRCASRALALLPDLRLSGVVRALFAFKRAGTPVPNFVDEVSRFLLDECRAGRAYEDFLGGCTANDALLLYKAFAVNDYFDVELYCWCTELLSAQVVHMIPSDCCVFFQSHVRYLSACKGGNFRGVSGDDALSLVLRPSLAHDLTLRFLLRANEATPGDIAVFADWLVPLRDNYGIPAEAHDHLASLFEALTRKPEMFNVEHIHRLVQSTCAILCDIPSENRCIATTFIATLLHETERRSEPHEPESALRTLYALDIAGLWRFDVMQGILYSVVNNVTVGADATRVQEILQRRSVDQCGDGQALRMVPAEFAIDPVSSSVERDTLASLISRVERRVGNILSS